jgi:hypothetical protein
VVEMVAVAVEMVAVAVEMVVGVIMMPEAVTCSTVGSTTTHTLKAA